jgi:hypothetical protein
MGSRKGDEKYLLSMLGGGGFGPLLWFSILFFLKLAEKVYLIGYGGYFFQC